MLPCLGQLDVGSIVKKNTPHELVADGTVTVDDAVRQFNDYSTTAMIDVVDEVMRDLYRRLPEFGHTDHKVQITRPPQDVPYVGRVHFSLQLEKTMEDVFQMQTKLFIQNLESGNVSGLREAALDSKETVDTRPLLDQLFRSGVLDGALDARLLQRTDLSPAERSLAHDREMYDVYVNNTFFNDAREVFDELSTLQEPSADRPMNLLRSERPMTALCGWVRRQAYKNMSEGRFNPTTQRHLFVAAHIALTFRKQLQTLAPYFIFKYGGAVADYWIKEGSKRLRAEP